VRGVIADIAMPRLTTRGELPDPWVSRPPRTGTRAPATAASKPKPMIVHQHFAPGAFQLSIRDVKDIQKLKQLIESLPSAVRQYGVTARPRPV
jgi:hypothetical protein